MNAKAHAIQQKAYELGYEKCGIIPLSYMHEFEIQLEERIEKVPSSAGFYERQKRLIDPRKDFPWAKSVVVVAERYGDYKLPNNLKGRIGRPYLFDTRIDENTESFEAGLVFDAYLKSLGLQSVTERKFGLVGLRWAAMQAGLGIIRRNNFLHTIWFMDNTLCLVDR